MKTRITATLEDLQDTKSKTAAIFDPAEVETVCRGLTRLGITHEVDGIEDDATLLEVDISNNKGGELLQGITADEAQTAIQTGWGCSPEDAQAAFKEALETGRASRGAWKTLTVKPATA